MDRDRTGWPPGLLQDDSKELSRWFASKPDARHIVRQVCKEIGEKMEREKIIRLAHAANFEGFGNGDWVCTTEEIERFAALVAAHEREACAKVCEAYDHADPLGVSIECAAAIRGRT